MNRTNSSFPSESDLTRPSLEYAGKQKGDFGLAEVTEAMGDLFGLTSGERKKRTEGGHEPCLYNRVRRGISKMEKAGLLHRPQRGRYEITKQGKKEIISSKEKITTTYLSKKYEAYREWQKQTWNS